jgi:hypothetical protein
LALTPQNNEAFFREVDDEVRREQVQRLARRYGILIGIAIVLALAAFAAVLLWRSHQDKVAGERSEQLTAAISALSAGNTAKAGSPLDALVAADAKGYTPIARLLQADMLVQQNKQPQAAALFTKVADDGATPQPIRDLALIRATALGFDTLAPQAVIDRLKPLAVAGNPWFGSAGEMTGIAYLKLDQPLKAGPMFAAVARDRSVPQSLRSRTGQLAADLGIEIVQPADSPQP